MDAIPLEPARRTALRPWLLILLTGPLVVVGLALLAYRWQAQKFDLAQLTEHFVQRQNQVLAHDALFVSRSVSNLLLQANRDARLLSAAGLKSSAQYEVFLAALVHPGLEGDKEKAPAFPLYNRILVLPTGGHLLFFADGKIHPKVRSAADCQVKDLCDLRTLEAAASLPVGKALVGKALRWYTPLAPKREQAEQGTLSVAYRSKEAVYVLGIDFRSLLALLRLPTFPYQPKGDLLQDYEAGNYIYILDADTDLLAHPRRSHMMGIDPQTGQRVPPMKNDADAGTHPLNFRAYQDGKLRPYFDRLIGRSFQGNEVDVFQASNLSGTSRVISVAPITLDSNVFVQKGPFGYVGVGCALEHFREPEERVVPYY